MTRENENVQRWRKTKRGLVTNLYSKMKSRRNVEFSLEWIHSFSESKKFDRLFLEWVKFGYEKKFKPTIDRINCKSDYTKRNVQWLSWADNRFKQTMERRARKGPVIQLDGLSVVARFRSQREVVKKTGIRQGNISSVLNGRRKLAGGFSWQYENPELLK